MHPGGTFGAAEIALMNARLAANDSVVVVALDKMLNGTGVPPKVYKGPNSASWFPFTNTPLNYPGPYAMTK